LVLNRRTPAVGSSSPSTTSGFGGLKNKLHVGFRAGGFFRVCPPILLKPNRNNPEPLREGSITHLRPRNLCQSATWLGFLRPMLLAVTACWRSCLICTAPGGWSNPKRPPEA
jgi:hypothetical protein